MQLPHSLSASATFSRQAVTLDESLSNSTRVAASSDKAIANPSLALASFAAASDRIRLATDSLKFFDSRKVFSCLLWFKPSCKSHNS